MNAAVGMMGAHLDSPLPTRVAPFVLACNADHDAGVRCERGRSMIYHV
jgi:hypothetical protein